MIPFHKYIWLYFSISALVICTGLFYIVRYGFTFSVDFTGGSQLSYRFSKQVSEDSLRQVMRKEGITAISLQSSGNEYQIRTRQLNERVEAKLRAQIKEQLGVTTTVLRVETVGPAIGKETLQKTLLASLIAVAGILLYMSFAFKGFDYALAAVIAMLHDVMIVVGLYAVLSHTFGAELDLMFVSALLTTMSFSVHDTIVIFDKIREYAAKKTTSIEARVDMAITETMVRSLNNSLTIIFMLVALLLFGGQTIRFFVAALLIGTVTGTYSSPFVAAPLLILFSKKKPA